ncbi:hypothetical protein QUH32_28935, partial [Klebsiella pneumoniae]|nr:hypothetical protein [Klebsiella pneumoniae]
MQPVAIVFFHPCRLQAWTFPAGIEARWLGEGILQLLPTAPWRQATILSAGVHG